MFKDEEGNFKLPKWFKIALAALILIPLLLGIGRLSLYIAGKTSEEPVRQTEKIDLSEQEDEVEDSGYDNMKSKTDTSFDKKQDSDKLDFGVVTEDVSPPSSEGSFRINEQAEYFGIEGDDSACEYLSKGYYFCFNSDYGVIIDREFQLVYALATETTLPTNIEKTFMEYRPEAFWGVGEGRLEGFNILTRGSVVELSR